MKDRKISESLTAIVLTKDEAANIRRCLEALCWVPRVLVVDSFSSDQTTEIARSFPNVEVTQREFDSFAGQCNHALQLVGTEWVISLDADYVVSDELRREITALPASDVAGYRVPFAYCIHGRPLRGTLYPARSVLYRKAAARYEDFGHGHKVRIEGRVQDLAGHMLHDDRKPLSRWLQNQIQYAKQEAEYLDAAPDAELSTIDKIRRAILPAPLAVGFYVMFAKLCVLDGWAGWHYTMQRVLAEVLISLELVDRKLAGGRSRGQGQE
jgi:glycosyltransferase involved in cell wall biosynthesis